MLTLDPKLSPKKLDEPRLDELASKVRDGTITAEEKEELTGSFIRLTFCIAKSLGGSNHTKVEDYVSCGLFGIAYAIWHAQEKLKDQNIAAWIIYNIKEHIRRFRRRDHSVPVPASTYTKAKREGRPLPVAPTVHSLGSHEPCSELGNVYELREIIQLCAKDDEDRQIIRLRLQGYKDVEIAEKMGVSKSHVNNKRNAIESRFDSILREDL